jgi:dehydrogenase/reductase SDR family protein 7B
MGRRFEGRTVWITGASSGIGEATAREFSQEGARVILSARRRDELERVARACVSGATEVVPLDLAASDALAGIAADVLARFGPVDVMVHNGGVSQRALAKDTTPAVDRRIMEVNYFGAVALTSALLPSMLARRAGHFVVVTSLVGKFGTPLRSSYAASKHALHGYFDSLRAELHGDGVRVTLVCPGFVRTNVSLHALTGDGSPLDSMDRQTGRGMSPEACARALLEATARGDEEILVGGYERVGVYAKRYVPGVFSRLIRRVPVT